MYAFIAGRLEDPGPPTVLSAGGIGYEIFIPERHRLRLPHVGEEMKLHTHLVSREDGMSLYGFATSGEREFFRSLLSVSGVGPKLALAILGDENAEAILADIKRGDPRLLTKVKGVGKKTAERLMIELRDKDVEWVAPAAVTMGGASSDESEAVLALQAMGVDVDVARLAVGALEEEQRQELSVEELVRAALRRLAAAGHIS